VSQSIAPTPIYTKYPTLSLTAIEEWFFYYLTGRISERFAEDIQEYRIIVEEEGLIETSPSYDAESLYDSSP